MISVISHASSKIIYYAQSVAEVPIPLRVVVGGVGEKHFVILIPTYADDGGASLSTVVRGKTWLLAWRGNSVSTTT